MRPDMPPLFARRPVWQLYIGLPEILCRVSVNFVEIAFVIALHAWLDRLYGESLFLH